MIGIGLPNWPKYSEEFIKGPRVTAQPKNDYQNESLWTIHIKMGTLIKCLLRRISFPNHSFANVREFTYKILTLVRKGEINYLMCFDLNHKKNTRRPDLCYTV